MSSYNFPRPPAPPGRWQRAFYVPLTILAWLFLAIVVLWLLGHVAHTVVMIVLAAIIAFALDPLIWLLRRRLSQPLAIASAYLIGLALVIGLGFLLIYTAAQQVVVLVQNLPDYAQRVQALEPRALDALRPFGVTGENIQSVNQQALAEAQRVGTALAAGSVDIARSVAANIVDAVLILILSVYFALGGPRVATWLQEKTPESWRLPARFLVRTVNQVLGGYVRGTLTMALLIGVLVGLGLWVLRVPYAVLLGVLAFFMEFIPVVGVLISGVVSLLVALPRGMGITIAVLIYFVLVHIIESDVVGPRIMGKAVGIHPATGIIALLAGSELFGVWGALFAAPLAGLMQAAVTAVWRGMTDAEPSILAAMPPEMATEVTQAAQAAEDNGAAISSGR